MQWTKSKKSYSNNGSIDLSNRVHTEDLTVKAEGTFNVSGDESLDFELGLDNELLDLSENTDGDVESDRGRSSGGNINP